MKKESLVEGKIDGHERRIWITNVATGYRYELPVKEYKSRYKDRHGIGVGGFEWGYIGNGPDFLSWALTDELIGSEASQAQREYITRKVTGAAKHGSDFEFTLEL